MKTAKITTLSIVALAVLFLASPAAWAGCGCDHPTPCPTPVTPPYASPGDAIELTGLDFSMDPDGYEVEFKKGKSSVKETKLERNLRIKVCDEIKKQNQTKFRDKAERQRARHLGELLVNVPAGEHDKEAKLAGPVDIKVKGHEDKNIDDEYQDSFVYLGRPLQLEEAEGHYIFVDFPIAVDSAGVIYIPLDLSNIQAAMNFAVYIDNLPLDFGSNDVIMYNKDGFNLNLFTLDVEGYEKQWGEWYGAQTMENADKRKSDLVTYWRHDFYEYHAAHQPGGSHYAHTENEDGHLVHPDETIHVDHDRLVVAVSGYMRDKKYPEDPDRMTQLKGGRILNAEIHVLQLKTDDPDAFTNMSTGQVRALSNYKLGTPHTPDFFKVTDTRVLGGNTEMEICIDDDDDDD